MKIISFEDIKSVNVEPKDCCLWVSKMIAKKNETFLPPKTHMDIPENTFCNVMPCYISGAEGQLIGGVKVVTRYPSRTPSLDSKILLFNANSGEFLALMDGNWITAMRTGAVAAHSIILFAKRNWNTVGMIGLGNVARATLLMLDSMIDHKINIKLLNYKNQAENIQKRFEKYSNLCFTTVNSVEDCIRDSEVVISCPTYFDKDIAHNEWFDEGVLVVPVHTRGFTNCDLFFDKIFADDTGHVNHFGNFSKFKYFAEVSDVVNGRSPGRENDKERILTYNIGVAIHDINFAHHIYNLIKDKSEIFNSLSDANMYEPAEKFWV